MKIHKIPLLILNKLVEIPTKRGSSVIRDIYADLDENTLMIQPHKTATIHTSLMMDIPQGWVGMITGKNTLAVAKSLSLVNGITLIDSEFKNEEIVLHFRNDSDCTQIIEHKEKVAQIVFIKAKDIVFYPTIKRDINET